MSRRRFFVPEVRRGRAELVGDDAEHLVRVLRAEVGQKYEISDNAALYLAEIESARKSSVVFTVLEQLASEPEPVTVMLLPALFKFDRFELLVEKATELGVAAIQPWEAVRTERGLRLASSKRVARWQKIAIEASQQARRARLPVVQACESLTRVLETAGHMKLLLDESPDAPPLLDILLAQHMTDGQVLLLSGPEGGFTDGEREQAHAAGFRACSLGRTVLRAETAAMAALAVVRSVLASRL